MKRHSFVPTAPESLEGRLALSHVAAAPVAGPVKWPVPPPPHQHTLDLQGIIQGSEYDMGMAAPAGGPEFLQGAGSLKRGLGAVRLGGYIFIWSGEPTFFDGYMSLYNRHGSVTLHVFGIQGGPAGPPSHLRYSIDRGTGAYLGSTGTGKVALESGGPIVCVNPKSTLGCIEQGSFTLAFGDARLPIVPTLLGGRSGH